MTGEDIGRVNLDDLRASRRATLQERIDAAQRELDDANDRDDYRAIERLTRKRDYWKAEQEIA